VLKGLEINGSQSQSKQVKVSQTKNIFTAGRQIALADREIQKNT
jgi:hypothetical protein